MNKIARKIRIRRLVRNDLLPVVILAIAAPMFAVYLYKNTARRELLLAVVVAIVIACIVKVCFITKRIIKLKSSKDTDEPVLTSEYTRVMLKDFESIPRDVLKCMAKVDEEGKVTFKIEGELENYEEFFKSFDFYDA